MQKVIAVFLLALSLPLLIILAMLIFMADLTNPFFVQERVGLHKKPFKIIKFRSMKNGRITVIGRMIRKTGMDEIPQLINIIRGEMAFVGPRPLTQADIERLEWNGAGKADRWKVLPGITGPAQLINVCDKDVSFDNDLNYIRQKSASADLKFVFLSLIIPITGKTFVKKQINIK